MNLKGLVHRISCEPSSQHVRVSANARILAETDRPVLMKETGLPVRFYIPKDDVHTDLFEPTSHRTTCPWKGQASYWSATVDDVVLENVAWSYEDPIPEAVPIRGMLACYPDRVDIELDGVRQ